MMALAAESQNPLLPVALEYAESGWAVVPLHSPTSGHCSCRRSDCGSPGKHPRPPHGLTEASADPIQIEKWWRRSPLANIGIRTGRESGLIVLDVDPDHGGNESLDALVREHGPLPNTLVVATGGGGCHFYFEHPGEEIQNDAGKKLGRGLDVRGDGGYVVAPPSLHVSGQFYSWDTEAHGDLAKLPDWLLIRLRKPEPVRRLASVLTTSGTGLSRYAKRALEGELEELGRSPEGGRNHALNAAAFNLGQLVGGRELVQGVVEDALMQKAASIGLTDSEARATIASGLGAGLQNPRTAPEKLPIRSVPVPRALPRSDNPPRDPKTPSSSDNHPGEFHLSDVGNGMRLAHRHGSDLRYCAPQDSWYVWDGRCWAHDDRMEVDRRAVETVFSIYHEIPAAADSAERAELRKHAVRSEADPRIQAMIRRTRSEPGIPIKPDQLDNDPWLLNCFNGVVNLGTGEMREHRREDLLTKLVPVEYELGAYKSGAAGSELWRRFLRDVTGGDEELEQFLQRAAGYSATGFTTERCLFFVHGPTTTGKSTFMETLTKALGGYATTSDFETFLARNQIGGPREDIARLAGSRLVMSVEVDEGKRLAEGLVKTITGGDTVAARHLFKGTFEFRPQFALWLVANHAPRVRDDDDAMWKRIHEVPFVHTVSPEHFDPDLKAKLSSPEAMRAVLSWVVQGAVDWHRRGGLGVPASVREATQKYREDMDPLKDFLEDCCVIASSAWASTDDLRDAYEAWGRAIGERRLLSPKAFGERLSVLGCFSQRRRAGGRSKRGWWGIGLAGEPV